MDFIIQKDDGGPLRSMKHAKFPYHTLTIPITALLSLGALLYMDLPARSFVREIQQTYPIVRHIAYGFTQAGYNFYMLIAIAIFLFERAWYTTPNNPLQNIARHCYVFLWSALLAGGIVHIIKFVVGRYRPSSDLFTFDPFSGHISFPSGHSQTIFTVVVYIICALRPRPAIGTGLIIFGIFVASSRIFLNHHFLSDVIMGGAIGGYISFLIVKNIDFLEETKIHRIIEKVRRTD